MKTSVAKDAFMGADPDEPVDKLYHRCADEMHYYGEAFFKNKVPTL